MQPNSTTHSCTHSSTACSHWPLWAHTLSCCTAPHPFQQFSHQHSRQSWHQAPHSSLSTWAAAFHLSSIHCQHQHSHSSSSFTGCTASRVGSSHHSCHHQQQHHMSAHVLVTPTADHHRSCSHTSPGGQQVHIMRPIVIPFTACSLMAGLAAWHHAVFIVACSIHTRMGSHSSHNTAVIIRCQSTPHRVIPQAGFMRHRQGSLSQRPGDINTP